MGVSGPVRIGVLGLVGCLCTGLLWLGVVRYQADRRAASAATETPGSFQAGVGATPDTNGASKVVEPAAPPPQAPRQIVVHVVGAVARPGIYRLDEGARAADALEAAGGALPEGLSDALNLAARVSDGDKIFVADRRQPLETPPVAQGATVLPVKSVSAAAPTKSSRKLPLNSASVRELDGLPGISPATAQAIVDYRQAKGPYKSIADLDNVKGIGPATIDKIRNLVEL